MADTGRPSASTIDPGWEPYSVQLRVSVTRSYALALERFSSELRLSKSMLIREAVRRGLPALVNDVRALRAAGYRPSTHLAGYVAYSPRRGPAGEGVAGPRWSKVPGRPAVEPEPAPPLVDDD